VKSSAPSRSTLRRLLPLAALALGSLLFIALGGGRYLSFAALAAHRQWLVTAAADNAVLAGIAFILGYAGLVALSFPAAEVLTIVGGFLFGRWLGAAYTVIGATTGATVVFLAARAGFAGLAERAGPRAERLVAGFRRNPFNYLIVLRLVPLFPFWLVNLVAAAAGLPLRVYVLATLIGIMPATFVYASLGTGLGTVIAQERDPDLRLLLHPSLLLPLLGLAALALLPLAYRRGRGRGRPAE
jgi:uncharacterized membrane protein YdjX (TVP38/TMEM64 family)